MNERYKTSEFSYLIGALADGSLYHNQTEYIYRVSYYQHSKEYLLHCIEPRIIKLFNKRGHFYFDARKAVNFYEIVSKEIYNIYKEAIEEFKADIERSIPSWIQAGESKIKYAFISGFFDADGYYHILPENSDYRVRFGQSEYQVLAEIKKILEEEFRCSEVLGPYKSKEIAKPYYELHIHGIKQVKKFKAIIRPCHPDKQLKEIF
jgi:intein/homing endonuclease